MQDKGEVADRLTVRHRRVPLTCEVDPERLRLALALFAAATEVVEIEGVDEIAEGGRQALRLGATTSGGLASLAGRARLDLLTLGVSIDQTIEGETKGRSLRFIDWENPRNNAFHVTAQFNVARTASHETRRPDIIGFVNAQALRVGDTVYVGDPIQYPPVPSFAGTTRED